MTTELHVPVESGSAPDPLTDRVRATWTAGDFGRIAKGYWRGAGEFIVRLELEPNERVLDVACGTGNLALPAARVGASVTGIDIAPNLIAQGARVLRFSDARSFDDIVFVAHHESHGFTDGLRELEHELGL